MKANLLFLFGLSIMAACHSSDKKPVATNTTPVDTTKMYYDSSKADLVSKSLPTKDAAAPLKTHLKDTSYLSGNFILFLIPDKARSAELDKGSDADEMHEADGDFAAGIYNTVDSVRGNSKYKKIKANVSYMRYILIKDCLNGPLVIDRDTVNFGYILSGTGKQIKTEYNSVHSGDYLGEIDDYFPRE